MKRGLRLLVPLLAGVIVMLVVLVLARKPITEWAATTYLASRGVEPVTLAVTRLDMDGIAVERLLIGDVSGAHVRVRKLSIRLDGLTLVGVDAAGVEITGRLRDGRPDTGPIMALIPNDSAAAEPAPFVLPDNLPEMVVEDVRLALSGEMGNLALDFGGTAILKRGVLTVAGPLRIDGPGGAGQGEIEVTLRQDLTGRGKLSARDLVVGPPWLPQDLNVPTLDLVAGRHKEYFNADLVAAVAGGAVTFSLIGSGPVDRLQSVIDVEVALPDLAPLLPMVTPFADSSSLRGGSVDLSLSLNATTDGAVDLAGQLASAKGEGNLVGQVMLIPTQAAVDGQLDGISLDLDVDGTFVRDWIWLTSRRLDGRVTGPRSEALPAQVAALFGPDITFALEEGARVSLPRSDPTRMRLVGEGKASMGEMTLTASVGRLDIAADEVRADKLALHARGIAVDGLAIDAARFAGDLQVTDGITLQGSFAGHGEWDGGENIASGLSFAADLTLDATGSGDTTATGNGTINIDETRFADGAVVISESGIDFRRLSFTSDAAAGTSVSVTLQASQSAVQVAAIGTEPIRIQPLTLTLDLTGDRPKALSGPFTLGGGGMTVPALLSTGAIALDGRLDTAASTIATTVRLADVVIDPALVPGVPPITFDATVNAGQRGIRLDGIARTGPVDVKLVAAMNPETGEGDAVFELPPTALTRVSDHLRETVLPEGVSLTDGTLSAHLEVHNDKDLSGKLNIIVEDAAVTTADASVAGINADFHLTELFPPQTGAPQEVRIARLDGPAGMTDMLLRFDLAREGEETIARIDHLSGKVFGGELALQPFTLRADEERRAVDVTLRRIDMTRIVELTGLEGFALTGELSGSLPVVIAGDSQVAVSGGLLRADGPGVLRLDGQALRGVLGQQGGEQLDLMIRALEDFRYDTLEIAIDKALEGDADMRITLGGLNPAVLDGHPFRFNISVKGNADRLLETILTVYRASGGVIEQGIKSLQ